MSHQSVAVNASPPIGLCCTSVIVLWGLLGILGAVPVCAQQQDDLVREYLRSRTRVLAEQHMRETGGRAAARPTEMLPTRSDSIRQALLGRLGQPEEVTGPEVVPYEIHHIYRAGKFERPWYRRRYGDVKWSYLGANGRSSIDTLWTRDLRARLEARFGPPTQRLTDFGADSLRRREDVPQFEYWFVLNGNVPFLVMDTNGPFERGLVVATDHHYRERLLAMRQAFLGPIVQQQERAPYVDYYYDRADGTWHRIQFDGEAYDLQQARPPHSRNAESLERLRARQDDDQ